MHAILHPLAIAIVLAALALGLTPPAGAAEIIPASRRIAWDPGIPGGIPARTTISATLTGIDATGATDVRAAIQAALDRCPVDQVVKLPPGTFRIVGGLRMPSGVTLRGSGPSTVLKSHGSTPGLIQFGAGGLPWDPNPITTGITGGASAGATSISLASSSGIAVGTYLVITEANDPSFVSIDGTLNGPATWVDGWNTAGTRARGQIVEVTSVSGTTVGFSPALYASYTRTPWATRFAAQCQRSGVEDLKTYANDTGTLRNVLFQCAAYCWVKDVECDYTDGDHVSVDWSYRCEIRRSHFHDAYIHTSGQFDSMIGLRYKSSGCLVIDNILRRLHVSVMCEWGAAGNVIAYNYDEGNFNQATQSGNRWLPVSMASNHGAHPQFNLFEGNVSQKFQADAYWGSSSATTVFRNRFTGTGVAHPPYTGRGPEDTSTTAVLIQANRAIDIWELQSTYNVVGNVVGTASMLTRGAVRRTVNPASRGYDNPPCCFSYGYISEASGGGGALQNPVATLLEHGNHDVVTGGAVWDPAIAERVLPASLFLASKPAWWGSTPWPAIGPDVPGLAAKIPAQLRYEAGSGGDVTPPSVVLTAPAANATVRGVVTVSATASDAVGVAGVRLRVDGVDTGVEDTSAPYAFAWSTTAAASGPHTLTAVARDAAGNVAVSSSVTVTVANPTVSAPAITTSTGGGPACGSGGALALIVGLGSLALCRRLGSGHALAMRVIQLRRR